MNLTNSNIVASEEFADLSEKNLDEVLNLLLNSKTAFSIIVKTTGVNMNPEIAGVVNREYSHMRFDIVGYSFDTAISVKNKFIFRAGFGSGNNIKESEVSINLLDIYQIFIGKNPILINFAEFSGNIRKNQDKKENDLEQKIDRAKLFKSKNRELFGEKD